MSNTKEPIGNTPENRKTIQKYKNVFGIESVHTCVGDGPKIVGVETSY
jgi:hypothetical protein